MRRLSPRVNVIPVIGKADSLTPSELASFKIRVTLHSLRKAVKANTSTLPDSA